MSAEYRVDDWDLYAEPDLPEGINCAGCGQSLFSKDVVYCQECSDGLHDNIIETLQTENANQAARIEQLEERIRQLDTSLDSLIHPAMLNALKPFLGGIQ
jgi:hypothetical protein